MRTTYANRPHRQTQALEGWSGSAINCQPELPMTVMLLPAQFYRIPSDLEGIYVVVIHLQRVNEGGIARNTCTL
jgi:hypothetical protein